MQPIHRMLGKCSSQTACSMHYTLSSDIQSETSEWLVFYCSDLLFAFFFSFFLNRLLSPAVWKRQLI